MLYLILFAESEIWTQPQSAILHADKQKLSKNDFCSLLEDGRPNFSALERLVDVKIMDSQKNFWIA